MPLYFSHPLPKIEKQLGRDDDDDSSQSQPENVAAAIAATRLQSLTSGASSSLAPNCRKEKQEEGEPGRAAAGHCVKTKAFLDIREGAELGEGGARGRGGLEEGGATWGKEEELQQAKGRGGKICVATTKTSGSR